MQMSIPNLDQEHRMQRRMDLDSVAIRLEGLSTRIHSVRRNLPDFADALFLRLEDDLREIQERASDLDYTIEELVSNYQRGELVGIRASNA